ncbi:hypothetical protein QFZ42_003925 [Variovorax paradoxus]|nr:hypothetical protein [Variovorax paradoxus]
MALGYVHNLSKRTALYATVARVSNKNGAALTVGAPAFINTGVFTPKNSTGRVISASNPDASYHRQLSIKTPLEKTTCAMPLYRR